jgi:hypothetical protein
VREHDRETEQPDPTRDRHGLEFAFLALASTQCFAAEEGLLFTHVEPSFAGMKPQRQGAFLAASQE